MTKYHRTNYIDSPLHKDFIFVPTKLPEGLYKQLRHLYEVEFSGTKGFLIMKSTCSTYNGMIVSAQAYRQVANPVPLSGVFDTMQIDDDPNIDLLFPGGNSQ